MARKRAEDPAWVKANNDRYLAKYPERLKARKHAYYLKNKANWAFFNERYRTANPEKCATAIAAWGKRNPEKRKAYDAKSNTRPERKAKNSARQMRRHVAKISATPPWANLDAIQEVYDFAAFMTRETGERWEVDHIYPLTSDRLCGLHCEFNLQVITKSQNCRKSNKIVGEL